MLRIVLVFVLARFGSSVELQRDNKLLEINLSNEDFPSYSTPFSDDQPKEPNVSYLNYKNTYGLKFDPSVLETRLQNFVSVAKNEITTIDPKLDFSVQHVKKINQKRLGGKRKATNVTRKPGAAKQKRRRRKVQYFNIRNPLSVVSRSDKPLNDSVRIKTLEKYHRVLGSLKKTMRKLKRLTLDNSTKVVPDVASARWLDVLDIVEFESKPFCTSPRPLTGLTGQCYSEKKCANLGGIALDFCSYGYGVCCICKLNLR